MSHKLKNMAMTEGLPAEKFFNKLIRLENTQAARKGATGRQFTEKHSHILKFPQQKLKPKVSSRQQSPVPRVFGCPCKEQDGCIIVKEPKTQKVRNRSMSEARYEAKEKEAWGQILMSNKSREKVSNFSSFDPLRTLHFLSKELQAKLKNVAPGNEEIIQMVTDIQHALKRIPPEVSTFLHKPLETSDCVPKSVSTKTCQTPPTMYQEDTEKFQKLMEENTYRLEASCKQLELVCTNLQTEKEITEKELDEARENIDLLCKKVKEMENEIELLSTVKVGQLEDDKRHLEQELEKARLQISSSVEHNKKLIEEVKRQKKISDENCGRLEYDMTLLKMEKEKYVTMLGIRDREIKEIQEEMSKIQDQVNQQLKKLSTEVVHRANSMGAASDSFLQVQDNLFEEVGDTTISSISTIASETSFIKESPCGDAELTGMTKEMQGDVPHKLKVRLGAFVECCKRQTHFSGTVRTVIYVFGFQADKVELNLADNDKERDAIYEDLLAGLSPSLKSLLTSDNL